MRTIPNNTGDISILEYTNVRGEYKHIRIYGNTNILSLEYQNILIYSCQLGAILETANIDIINGIGQK